MRVVVSGSVEVGGGINNFAAARFTGDFLIPISTTNTCALRLIEKYGLRLRWFRISTGTNQD